VIAQVAALTPGPYLHFGGDEVKTLTEEQYAAFVERAEKLVREQGKTAVGWHEITKARLSPGTVAQYWQPGPPDPGLLAPGGPRFVLSPADHTYLDMKYDATTKLGLSWAGLVEVRDAYDWNPDALLPGVPADRILGVEAPIWTETLTTLDDLTTMALPRLPAIAELGWSAAATHDWASFRRRLAAQAPRWTAMGLAYYRSPQIPWPR
jgi:hexosaminidase